MRLRDILGNYFTKEKIGNLSLEITDINHDSRKIFKDNLFVAIKGFNFNGHDFIDEALDKGAICIVYMDDIKIKKGITYIRVENTTDALGFLSTNFYNNPCKKINMIGITGTNGKTSTSYYIRSILNSSKIKTGIIGTTGIIIEDEIIKIDNTTPDILILDRNLNNIFTNLTKDHLDYHKDMESYFKAKLKLFYKTNRFNIINLDDNYGKRIIEKIGNRVKLLTYGIDNKADVYATEIRYSIDKVEFVLNYNYKSINVKINTPGKFTVYNALASASCAIALGLDFNAISVGLGNIKGVKGRFELVPTNKDFTVIIDFAHTPDGLENVLKTVSDFYNGRKVIIFGAGGNRDRSKRPEMGEVVGRYGDFAIITSDNPRFEDPETIINDILEGIKNTNIEYKVIIDRKEAIKYALYNARPKDIILLFGKGHETYILMNGKVYPFDEREIVLDFLKDI
jgi:UDP-N-acetylmuramoyl-L-alanyl-D-glutamate--2,6-diaminopimelate ligase